MDQRSSSLFGFDLHSGSVTKHFGDALHDLGCIVAQTDDGIRTQLLGMLQAKLKRVLTGMKKGKPYYEGKYNTPDGNRMMIQVDENGKILKKTADDDPEPK